MIDIKKNPEAVGKLKVGTSAATPASGEVVATSVKAETYRSARSDGDIYIQAATASDFVAIGTQLSSTLLKVDGSGDTTLDGKLKLDDASVAGWIQSNGSVRVDIDNDDSSTDRAFVVSRDNASATLFSVNELGHVLVGAAALDANLGAKKMQLEGSASTSVGPEMLLHNPAQGGGAASLLTFGGKASGTEGYTAAIKATNTGTLTIGTAHASGGFSEPGADLTINSDGAVSIPSSTAAGSQLTIGNIHGKLTFNNTSGTSGSTIIQQSYTGGTAELRFGSNVSTASSSAFNISTGDAGLVTFNGGITVSGGVTSLGSFTNLDISSGAITITSSTHRVDTESGAASDDLDTINGGTDGSVLYLRTNLDTRDVTVKDATGNIYLAGDFALNNSQRILTLIKRGNSWYEVSRSANA